MDLTRSTALPAEEDRILTEGVSYRFPAIRPSIPPVANWEGYLQASYEVHWFSNFGPVSQQFEAALSARFCHLDEVMTCCNSATSGLAAALIASGCRGAVAVPAYTFPATGSAVLMAGAEPVVIDVDLETWVPAPAQLDDFLAAHRCSAVVLVSPFGLRRDFSRQIEICRRRGVCVVLDNAAGLSEKGEPLLDDHCFEIYSLHATKPFPVGEGGAIRSTSTQAPGLRCALNFGLEAGRARPGCWGINGKLPEFSAAIGLAVLEDFDSIVQRRRVAAQRYISCLSKYDGLVFPTDVGLGPWQVFPLLLPSARVAEAFIEQAATHSLQVRWSYKPTLDQWPRIENTRPCPNSVSLSERMVTLPIYSDMGERELTDILKIVRRTLEHALPA